VTIHKKKSQEINLKLKLFPVPKRICNQNQYHLEDRKTSRFQLMPHISTSGYLKMTSGFPEHD
jgi:hypothetical protein